jgi:hypothetical protein
MVIPLSRSSGAASISSYALTLTFGFPKANVAVIAAVKVV